MFSVCLIFFLVNQQLPDNLIWPFVFPFIFFTTYRFCHPLYEKGEKGRDKERMKTEKRKGANIVEICNRYFILLNRNGTIMTN